MGVDVPQSAVTTVLKEHAKWQKQLEKRHTSEYLKKKYWKHLSQDLPYKNDIHRCKLKQVANKRHETEKDYMVTLQAVGVTTSTYSCDTALEDDDTALETDVVLEGDTVDDVMSDEELLSAIPVLFFYDCETTGGSHLRDHIMEVGSVVVVPEGARVTTVEFSSLCHTSQHIVRQGSFPLF